MLNKEAVRVNISDISDRAIDKSGPQVNQFNYIDIKSIDRDKKIIAKASLISTDSAPSRAKQHLKKGDIIVSMTRPNLNAVAMVTADFDCAIASTGFHVIRPKNVKSKYIYYLVQSRNFIHEMCEKTQGALYPAVRPRDIESYEFWLPTINEQQRIIAKVEELFSELDSGIASLKTAQEQLKIYRQAILKHAFEGNLTAQWRKENADQLETSEQLLARIQNERETRYQQQLNDWKKAVKNWEVKGKESKKPSKPKTPSVISLLESNLPHGWSMVSLDCLLTTERKPMATGPFGTALSKSEHQPCGVPVLGIENIGSGKFLPGNKIFVTESKTEELLAFKVHPEDIIISRSGTVGEICEVPKNVTNALISTNLLRVSLNSDVVLSPFFVLMFQGGGVKLQVKDLCKGSSREFLNQTILNSISYPICGLNEQKALLRELDAVFSIIDQQVKEVDIAIIRAEALRQSILKKAFSGLLVPQNSNDELASELLARVKAKSERT